MTPTLYNFLTDDLAIEKIDYKSFCNNICKEFIEQKPDTWLIKFYSLSVDHLNLDVSRILKYKPIVRTAAGVLVPLYDSHTLNPNVYFPSFSAPKEYSIKSSLLNENSKTFFENMGVGVMNAADSLNFVVSKLNEWNHDQKIQFLEKITKEYKTYDDFTKNEIINLLRDKPIVLFENAKNNTEIWGKANEGYVKSLELEKLYDGCDEILFLSSNLITNKMSERKLISFLSDLGIHKSLRLIPSSNNLSENQKENYRSGQNFKSEFVEDHDMHCLDYILLNMDSDRFGAFLSLLCKQDSKFFKGVYSWKYSHSSSSKEFDASFVNRLNEEKWIIGSERKLISPREIMKKEFIKHNKISEKHLPPLLNILNFKPEMIDLLPDKDKQRLDLIKNIPIEELQEFAEKYENSKKIDLEEQFIEVSPWLNPSPFITPDFSKKHSRVSSSVSNSDKNIKNYGPSSGNIVKKLKTNVVDNSRKEIGNWAEENFSHSLASEYKNNGYIVNSSKEGFTAIKGLTKIKLINKNMASIQYGYDFELEENGKTIKYIEVKGKKSDDPELFPISGTQWEWAKKLYEDNKGDLYELCIVTSVGKEDSKISKLGNPYSLWINGKLYADPINIQF